RSGGAGGHPSSGAARHLLPQGEKGSVTESSRLNPLLPLREKVPEGRMRGGRKRRTSHSARVGLRAAFGAEAVLAEIGVEILLAVVVGELFAGGDVAQGADVDVLLVDLGLAIGVARVVDV